MNGKNGKDNRHIVVDDEIHKLIIKKQGEFFIKGIRKSMQEIANMAIREGLEKIKIGEMEIDERMEIKEVR